MAARKKNNDAYLWGNIIAVGFHFIASREWANLTPSWLQAIPLVDESSR